MSQSEISILGINQGIREKFDNASNFSYLVKLITIFTQKTTKEKKNTISDNNTKQVKCKKKKQQRLN